MSWLQRLFGREEKQDAGTKQAAAAQGRAEAQAAAGAKPYSSQPTFARNLAPKPAAPKPQTKTVSPSQMFASADQAKVEAMAKSFGPKEYGRPAPKAPEKEFPLGYGQGLGVLARMESPPDGVMELLNEQNWTTPELDKTKKVGMPDDAFDKDSIVELKQHDYKLTNEEWDRMQGEYASMRGQLSGYSPPAVSLNETMPLMKRGEQEAAPLTWEAYEALSDDQRAAVDFNTLLIEAREKDLSKPVTLDAAGRTEYDQKVEKLFGVGRGSDVVAQSTVDLLSQLDMNLVGQDLDEFLSLDRAIDTTELKDFKFSDRDLKTLDDLVNKDATESYAQVRSATNLGALDTAAVQKAQALLKSAAADPNRMTSEFGLGLLNPTATPSLGLGGEGTLWSNPADAQKNQWFQLAMQALSNPETAAQVGIPADVDTMSWLLEDMDLTDWFTPEDKQTFLNFVQAESDLLGNYGTPDDAKLAEAIRQRAGLGG
jgi:hypothetical protein